jgi:hypothetical protein
MAFVIFMIYLCLVVLFFVIGWRIMAATERIADVLESRHLRDEK